MQDNMNWADDAATQVGIENDGALGWDEEIAEESQFVTIEPGEYDFIVKNFARGRFEGSEKMSACPKAEIELGISYKGQDVTVKESLFLHKKAEWKLSQFFIAIGQKKHGEPLKMDWSKVLGARGRCKVKNEVYNNNTYNRVDSYLEPKGFTPGKF